MTVKIVAQDKISCPCVLLPQGKPKKTKAAVTVELEASENPTLDSMTPDPTIFCTAFKKNRFYMFTRCCNHNFHSLTVQSLVILGPIFICVIPLICKFLRVQQAHCSTYYLISQKIQKNCNNMDILFIQTSANS